ncbi:bifunctional (p)ppGpp synthetase/guanosine-3',5'-bis(diphosphate) 3'-pyrophosphohydrolase [Bacillus sp. DNRA2]|uniref:HD domain-containing protein n=1 Tax=Bacillus sp. DNRA2 TaxID=2723053 RepID=UPI00145D90AE|nr:HD domain-containing protein [Bacillus sp. DNRA2]NMD70386.1 bifunctional (p)ppGpp synthetase/guanosine-3',5'-bis(diphosphate) 3'-pyrophosphohydrolase [Bacillus sp. DNRA2]
MDLIDKALQIASIAHEHQYRKGTKIPYITHPIAVGMILLKAGYGDEVVAAGILHDTIEDTNVSVDEIEAEFGKTIAEIVMGCSEPDKSLSWHERKVHTIQFLKTASPNVRAVACADKLHNVRSIIDDIEREGETVWTRFNAGKEQQDWYYQSLVDSMGNSETFPLLKELQKAVTELFQ